MVYLLGGDHYLQGYDLEEADGEMRSVEFKAKEMFYELVKTLIQSGNIEFVGEECRIGQTTIPQDLASDLGCAYAQIDMPLDERERRGIARDYQELGAIERDRVYAMREDYMVARTYSESVVNTRKLIICGAEHLQGLETRFAQRGDSVTKRDLTKEDWVVEIYKKKRGDLEQRRDRFCNPRTPQLS